MRLIPYLLFSGDCREAFEFYRQVLRGGIVHQSTYAELPDMPDAAGCAASTPPPAWIAHVHLQADGTSLMGADGPGGEGAATTTVNVDVDSIDEAERVFGELSAGGEVKMPIGETFWAHRWGMLVDRYGKPWMVNCMKRTAN